MEAPQVTAAQVTAGQRSKQDFLVLGLTRTMRNLEANAIHLMGDIAAGHEPPALEEAVQHYRDALVLASELGMRPLAAHCHLGLGKLYRRTGKQDEAHEHLTTATTMYREMDMRFWLGKAEAEMSRLT